MAFNEGRLTRRLVQAVYNLSDIQLNAIVKLKQDYFISHLDALEVNEELLSFLSEQEKRRVVFFSAADECRRNAILAWLNLDEEYMVVDKKSFMGENRAAKMVQFFCRYFHCNENEIMFFDDDEVLAEQLTYYGIKSIKG